LVNNDHSAFAAPPINLSRADVPLSAVVWIIMPAGALEYKWISCCGVVVPIPIWPLVRIESRSVPPPEAALKNASLPSVPLVILHVLVPMLSVPAQSAFQRLLVAPRSYAERLLVYGPFGSMWLPAIFPTTESDVNGEVVP